MRRKQPTIENVPRKTQLVYAYGVQSVIDYLKRIGIDPVTRTHILDELTYRYGINRDAARRWHDSYKLMKGETIT